MDLELIKKLRNNIFSVLLKTAKVYNPVPVQDFSKSWSDSELYAKYDLSEDEISIIENLVSGGLSYGDRRL